MSSGPSRDVGFPPPLGGQNAPSGLFEKTDTASIGLSLLQLPPLAPVSTTTTSLPCHHSDICSQSWPLRHLPKHRSHLIIVALRDQVYTCGTERDTPSDICLRGALCKRLPLGHLQHGENDPGRRDDVKLDRTAVGLKIRRYCRRQDCSSQSPGTRGEACCIREELAISFPGDMPWRQHTLAVSRSRGLVAAQRYAGGLAIPDDLVQMLGACRPRRHMLC